MSTPIEKRVQRRLNREGLALSKGRGPGGWPGYFVRDVETNAVVGGGYPVAYGLTLDEAAEYVDWYRQAD